MNKYHLKRILQLSLRNIEVRTLRLKKHDHHPHSDDSQFNTIYVLVLTDIQELHF